MFRVNILHLLLHLLVLPVGGAVVTGAPWALGAIRDSGVWRGGVGRRVGGWGATITLFWSPVGVRVVLKIVLCGLGKIRKERRHVGWDSLLG